MQFRFDEVRATQAMGVLLKAAGGRENYTKLLKILYLADRESLAATGTPIAGARFCNMSHGPLASDVYDCIKSTLEWECPFWRQHIARLGRYDITMVTDPGDGNLSDYDIETLTGLYGRFRNTNFSGMIDFVHKLQEWHNPEGSSETLPPERIMKAAGVDEIKIAQFDEQNRHLNALDSLLTR